ncbi:hypothetical protein CANARDRAFT_211765 [[Candida] arabinofermentans NRRL YB-2248]|uniref:TRAM domain-containing protein n=1 Tax=[Candida] arabinofermentans NRRL YB-2248 TaxID=983967 RepID=A0A1E4T3Q4_9ASCO|nr:hypothetical protein CANARDRAFT_211765 [[Candida] arabinofermentans NRRL YB-2248]
MSLDGIELKRKPSSSSITADQPIEKDSGVVVNFSGGRKNKKHKRKFKVKVPESTTPLGVLLTHEIPTILKEYDLKIEDITNPISQILNDEKTRLKYNRIVTDVEILKYSSSGDSIALIPHPDIPTGKQIAIIPFGTPGDIVKIRVFMTKLNHVECDLLQIIKPSIIRNDTTSIECKYFGICSGCQYQHIDYENQLLFKKQTIENAFKFFAPRLTNLNKLPIVESTIPSPLKLGYRTKLTPHYQINKKYSLDKLPNIGFGKKGKPEWRVNTADLREYPGEVMDIEDCLIGTEIVRKGMANERARLNRDLLASLKDKTFKKRGGIGATILLREDTKLIDDVNQVKGSTDLNDEISKLYIDNKVKTCVTDNNSIVSEFIKIDDIDLRFDFVANEFFQNNNSILPKVIQYVKSNLSIDSNDENYLVDAYCGSGLFSIALSSSVTKSLGVEISSHSIKFAKKNVELNNIKNCEFIEGKAEELFKKIEFPKDKTSVILDPPRKGCDDIFLKQLSDFNPRKIVYVSCNVHSQARDIEYFINETENGKNYQVESITGFDFFPQTHHVEGVAVLKRC